MMSKRDDILTELCQQAMQGTATVLSQSPKDDGLYTLENASGIFTARQAASCLLVPEAGDCVWFCGDLNQGLYVTAVLQQNSDEDRRVCLPPGSSIEAAQGALTVRVDHLHFASRKLAVQTEEAVFSAKKLTGVGQEAVWSFSTIRVISELLESFTDRLVQFARWSQRTVDGLDQVRSRQIDHRAEQTMQLSAQHFIADASKLVKMDSEQIHLG
jgi:hypothetical protein